MIRNKWSWEKPGRVPSPIVIIWGVLGRGRPKGKIQIKPRLQTLVLVEEPDRDPKKEWTYFGNQRYAFFNHLQHSCRGSRNYYFSFLFIFHDHLWRRVSQFFKAFQAKFFRCNINNSRSQRLQSFLRNAALCNIWAPFLRHTSFYQQQQQCFTISI